MKYSLRLFDSISRVLHHYTFKRKIFQKNMFPVRFLFFAAKLLRIWHHCIQIFCFLEIPNLFFLIQLRVPFTKNTNNSWSFFGAFQSIFGRISIFNPNPPFNSTPYLLSLIKEISNERPFPDLRVFI